jgi:hypothetical protein
MKKVSAQMVKRIDEINALIQQANELELIVYTYGGGTFPHVVNIKPIIVKNQFVTIETASPSMYDFISKERFNVNNDDFWNYNGLESLKYCLKHIKKALVNALNNQ